MKKRVGELYGVPIVEGDSNLIQTSNNVEIDVKSLLQGSSYAATQPPGQFPIGDSVLDQKIWVGTVGKLAKEKRKADTIYVATDQENGRITRVYRGNTLVYKYSSNRLSGTFTSDVGNNNTVKVTYSDGTDENITIPYDPKTFSFNYEFSKKVTGIEWKWGNIGETWFTYIATLSSLPDLSEFSKLESLMTHSNCTSIEGVSFSAPKFMTDEGGTYKRYHSMFENAEKLEKLDLSGLDMTGKICMPWIFNGASSLKELIMEAPEEVFWGECNGMFCGVGLEYLDLSEWKTPPITCLYWFTNSKLKVLNLKGWDFCENLKDVHDWSFEFLEAFSGCTDLTTIIGPVYNISADLDLHDCPLDQESVTTIINGLATLSEGTTKTLTLNQLVASLLSDEQEAIAHDKGWNISIV